MDTRFMILAMMAPLVLFGCSLNSYQCKILGTYPASLQTYDVTFGWNKTLCDNGMIVKGYARNNRKVSIRDMELRVELVSPAGKTKAEETILLSPRELPKYMSAPFVVSLNVRPQKGDWLYFHYRYLAVEGADSSQTRDNSFQFKIFV